MHEAWEYYVEYMPAGTKDGKDYASEHWPDWDIPEFAPQTLIPQLNKNGALGWELVQLTPLLVGGKQEFQYPTASASRWGNWYLAVYRRPAER